MANPSQEELQQLITDLTNVAKSYDPSTSASSTQSRLKVLEKAKEVVRLLATPDEMAFSHCLNMTELVGIRSIFKLKVLDNIPVNGTISLHDLAEVTECQESFMERMLRALVATGFLDQTRPDGGDYKHTKFSAAYAQVPGPGVFVKAMYDEYFKPCSRLDEYLASHGPPYTEPDDVSRNPYTWCHGKDGTSTWAIMASFPERMQTFQIGLSGLDMSVPIVGYYDFSQLKSDEGDDRAEIVDVGGGQGRVLRTILEATPQLDPKKCILQDVPDVISLARESKFPAPGVKLMEHDFTQEQPVKGAKAYYMRFISHDYSDAANIVILSQLAKVMAPDSKVLIADMVIPSRVTEETLPSTVLDNIMFCLGGKERTEEGFRSVLDKSGLELVTVHRAEGTAGALVEARLKR